MLLVDMTVDEIDNEDEDEMGPIWGFENTSHGAVCV